MILSVSNIGKSFSEKTILENISFHLDIQNNCVTIIMNKSNLYYEHN